MLLPILLYTLLMLLLLTQSLAGAVPASPAREFHWGHWGLGGAGSNKTAVVCVGLDCAPGDTWNATMPLSSEAYQRLPGSLFRAQQQGQHVGLVVILAGQRDVLSPRLAPSHVASNIAGMASIVQSFSSGGQPTGASVITVLCTIPHCASYDASASDRRLAVNQLLRELTLTFSSNNSTTAPDAASRGPEAAGANHGLGLEPSVPLLLDLDLDLKDAAASVTLASGSRHRNQSNHTSRSSLLHGLAEGCHLSDRGVRVVQEAVKSLLLAALPQRVRVTGGDGNVSVSGGGSISSSSGSSSSSQDTFSGAGGGGGADGGGGLPQAPHGSGSGSGSGSGLGLGLGLGGLPRVPRDGRDPRPLCPFASTSNARTPPALGILSYARGQWLPTGGSVNKSFVCCEKSIYDAAAPGLCRSSATVREKVNHAVPHFTTQCGDGCCGCDIAEGTRTVAAARERFEFHPFGCRLLAWDAGEFCRVLAGRVLLLSGDSTMEQSFTTLTGLLAMDGRPEADCADQVRYGWSSHLMTSRFHNNLPDYLQQVRPDIVVFTAGAHFEDLGDMQNILDLLELALPRVPGTPPVYVWKSQSPAHFGCERWDAPYPPGFEYSPEESAQIKYHNWQLFPTFDDMARNRSEKLGWHYLDMSPLYLRPDGHIRGPKNDCLHYCLPGPVSLFAQLLLHMLSALRDSA